MRTNTLLLIGFSVLMSLPVAARAEDAAAGNYVLTLKDHKFTPEALVLPANQKITLVVKNEQSSPAEFESSDLNREKVVEANGQINVILGPLDAGSYGYFDDFHRDTTGTLTVK